MAKKKLEKSMLVMKNTERFSSRAENYVRYRPHYPAKIASFLKKEIGLRPDWKVADIGSGTGISSELFLQQGNTVYAVEPNKEMRKQAENLFKKHKNFISVNATAEATSLPDKSVDLILVGQAFHWFDKVASKKEFQRIAKRDAYLVLMWNERDLGSDFQQKYEQMLLKYAPAYGEVCQHNIDERAIEEFFSHKPYAVEVFPHAQYFDLEGLQGRLLSSSYAPNESHPNHFPIIDRLTQLFDQFSINGKIDFEYLCKVYYGKISQK